MAERSPKPSVSPSIDRQMMYARGFWGEQVRPTVIDSGVNRFFLNRNRTSIGIHKACEMLMLHRGVECASSF
jgi:hypothetical protein